MLSQLPHPLWIEAISVVCSQQPELRSQSCFRTARNESRLTLRRSVQPDFRALVHVVLAVPQFDAVERTLITRKIELMGFAA
jgi:hypothetical protein